MRELHEKAIKKFVEYLKTQEQYLALIIGGSVAKGLERDDSDIDVILVVKDDYYEKQKKKRRLLYSSSVSQGNS
ncbi:MAG: nucleotidyltransferase domain-containing protein [Promethearchaeota archaeon]